MNLYKKMIALPLLCGSWVFADVPLQAITSVDNFAPNTVIIEKKVKKQASQQKLSAKEEIKLKEKILEVLTQKMSVRISPNHYPLFSASPDEIKNLSEQYRELERLKQSTIIEQDFREKTLLNKIIYPVMWLSTVISANIFAKLMENTDAFKQVKSSLGGGKDSIFGSILLEGLHAIARKVFSSAIDPFSGAFSDFKTYCSEKKNPGSTSVRNDIWQKFKSREFMMSKAFAKLLENHLGSIDKKIEYKKANGDAKAEESFKERYEQIEGFLALIDRLPRRFMPINVEFGSLKFKELLEFYNERLQQKIMHFIHEQKTAVQNLDGTKGNILFLKGEPGTGKTHLVKAISELTGQPVVELNITSLKDIQGAPNPDKAGQILEGMVTKALDANNKTVQNFILFIDEANMMLNNAPEEVKIEFLKILQDRAFYSKTLQGYIPLHCTIIMAGNEVIQLPALANRVQVIEVDGFTTEQKYRMLLKYDIPALCKANGLDFAKDLTKEDYEYILKVVTADETKGIRNLQTVLREYIVAKAIVKKNPGINYTVNPLEEIKDLNKKYHENKAKENSSAAK